MLMHWLEISAAVTGLAGALMLALRGRFAPWGWAAFLASNAGWITFAALAGHHWLLAMQLGFTVTSLVGVWQWLVKPQRAAEPENLLAGISTADLMQVQAPTLPPLSRERVLQIWEETYVQRGDSGLEFARQVQRETIQRVVEIAVSAALRTEEASGAKRPYDEAVEAIRQALNKLPRHSFYIKAEPLQLLRVAETSGRWIEWQAAHELLDPVKVDALIAGMQARAAIKKAGG